MAPAVLLQRQRQSEKISESDPVILSRSDHQSSIETGVGALLGQLPVLPVPTGFVTVPPIRDHPGSVSGHPAQDNTPVPRALP